jgi:hypothetical protein
MEQFRRDLYEVVQMIQPCTVRQTFYQAVCKLALPKTENIYKQIGKQLVYMRREGRLPFKWIADNTRWQRRPDVYDSMEQCLYNTALFYRRDLWSMLPVHVEVWLEKDALAGVVYEETEKWAVPLMVSKGFSSLSYLYSAAEAIKDCGKPAYLYYLGDRDPSGVHIDKAIIRDLRKFAPDAEIFFERIAVMPWQIEEYNLPTRPTKKTDKRRKKFKGRSVELDAMTPHDLRALVCQSIEQHITADVKQRVQAVEDAERETLRLFGNASSEQLHEIARRLSMES